jgi:hypothetical protein
LSSKTRTKRSLEHISRIEQSVNYFAPILWRKTALPLRRWLVNVLRTIRPQVEQLAIEQRVYEAEIFYLQTLLEGLRYFDDPPDLQDIVLEFAESTALQFGFLPTDPRRQEILEYTTRILNDDLSSYWRSITDPETLARRMVKLRSEGKSYVEMSQSIANQYQTSFYRAERLVRSSYNSSANYASYNDLQEAGKETHSWLTARDSRVRRGEGGGADHQFMDGQTVRLGQPFVTLEGYRLLFPGDRSLGAPASHVVNCRCVTI